MEKFRNKYRIPSTRLQKWNYNSPGKYFITICTKYRIHFFGEIGNGIMYPNELGLFAYSEWEKIITIRKDMNLDLGEFVVMPNHIHGIIIIGENKFNSGGMVARRDAMHGVSTPAMHGVSTPATHGVSTYGNTITNKFGPQSKNIGSIIRGYKSSVTTFARKNNFNFNWQERFHDHIIRNNEEMIRITNYIKNNPQNWKEDKLMC